MKNNKWTLYLGILLPLAFSSCSSDTTEIPGDEQGPVEIRMSTGIASDASPVTRGDGMINSTLTADLNVSFARADKTESSGAAYAATYAASKLDGTVAQSGGTLTFSPKQYYLANGANTKLIGWYPQSGTYTQVGRTVGFNVDGSTDIMVTKLKEGNKASQITAVQLEHLLTQISVKAYAVDADAKTVWGGIKSIKIKGMKQTCTVTLPDPSSANVDAEATVAFTGTDDLPLVQKDPMDNSDIQQGGSSYGDMNPLELAVGNTAPVLAGYAMFAPVAAAGDAKITLEIAMEKGGAAETKEIILAAGYQKSNSYAITLKFTSAEIAPSVTVAAWTPATPPGEVEI